MDIPGSQFIQGHDILGVMVPDGHQIADFAVRLFRQVPAYLDVDPLVLTLGNEINFFCVMLADPDLVASPAELKSEDLILLSTGNR